MLARAAGEQRRELLAIAHELARGALLLAAGGAWPLAHRRRLPRSVARRRASVRLDRHEAEPERARGAAAAARGVDAAQAGGRALVLEEAVRAAAMRAARAGDARLDHGGGADLERSLARAAGRQRQQELAPVLAPQRLQPRVAVSVHVPIMRRRRPRAYCACS